MDHIGATPLHYAALDADIDMLQLLLDAGSCWSCRDLEGNMAISWAASTSGKSDNVDFLISWASAKLPSLTGSTLATLLWPAFRARSRLIGTPFFDSLFQDEARLHIKDASGLCPAHLLLTGHAHHFLWALNRGIRTLHPGRLEWGEKVVNAVPDIGVLARRLKLLMRVLGEDEMPAALGIRTRGQHSHLCEAARRAAIPAAATLLDAGSIVEHVCDVHGTPFQAAFSNGQLCMVKYLVWRGGAQISLTHDLIFRDGQPSNGVRFPALMEWIFVTRYTEQPKIANSCPGEREEEGAVSHWAGICVVAVRMKWEWKKGWAESMLEYARRRYAILEALRGAVAIPYSEEDDMGEVDEIRDDEASEGSTGYNTEV